MAPFNRRQIGYIQAIAGRQQHVTLKCGQDDGQISSATTPGTLYVPQTIDTSKVVMGGTGVASSALDDDAKSLLLHHWILDDKFEMGFDSRAEHNNNQLQHQDFTSVKHVGFGFGKSHTLGVFDAKVEGLRTTDANGHVVLGDGAATGELVRNPDLIPSTARATPDGFLNSTDVKFRFTLPTNITDANHSTNAMGQDHYEFRWIVWRNKRNTMHSDADDDDLHSNMDFIRDGCSFRNPGYDFFMGQTGRKRGFLGYTHNVNLDKDAEVDTPSERYSGKLVDGSSFGNGSPASLVPTDEANFTVDDILTMRINRDDYVVMKDVRFFLGKQHGKSHFEDTLHWDWNDPIDTIKDNVLTSPTLQNKNYRWHMTLIGSTGGKSPVMLNHSVRWTTKMESG